MTAGLERNIEGCAARIAAGLRKRIYFRMSVPGTVMVPFSQDTRVAHNQSADRRIRPRVAKSATGEFIAPLEEKLVEPS